jgi:hypothetical protein
MSLNRSTGGLLVWLVWSSVSAAGAPCDNPMPVRFAHGTAEAEISGGIVRGELACFTIEARKGQHMSLTQPQHDNVVLQLYPPPWTITRGADGIRVNGHAMPGALEGEDVKAWAGRLPATGSYLLVLGTTWGGGKYRLRIGIE